MSQRFTVSKSDGDRRGASDLIQGEVNQLFEGDEPAAAAASGGEADGKEAAADADAEEEDVVVVVALKALVLMLRLLVLMLRLLVLMLRLLPLLLLPSHRLETPLRNGNLLITGPSTAPSCTPSISS
ncbi:unnamed protein product [Merluccius merluccius]